MNSPGKVPGGGAFPVLADARFQRTFWASIFPVHSLANPFRVFGLKQDIPKKMCRIKTGVLIIPGVLRCP
jgi:hypothetical protein